MPELPEVETVVRGLRPILAGQTILAVTLRAPKSSIVVSRDLQPARFDELLTGKQVLGVRRRGKNILINLDNVTYIDSTGVGALVGTFTTIRNQGGQMKLSNLSQRVKDILLVTKLLTVFDVYDNEADGTKSFAAKK